jgi:tryptophan-rich sensory protein
MKNKNTWYSILWIFSPILLGLGSSALFIPKNKIPKVRSKWNPPGWVFGVVWPILYLLLGYSSYLVWQDKTGDSSKNKIIGNVLEKYIIHFVLLLLWWPYFVYFPNAIFATISLFLLAISAVYIGWNFYMIHKTAGYCWIPYTIWLFFATFLTSQTIYTKD